MKITWTGFLGMDRNVWIRLIGETLNGIAMMMMMPFFALYLKDRVGSLLEVGIIIALSPIAASIGSIIGGYMADIYGRKPLMVISMASNGLLMFLFLFVDGFISYAILSIGLGLCNSFFEPAASAMVSDVTEPTKRTEAYGLLRMAHNIGAAIGPLLGTLMIGTSKNIVFIATGGTMLLYTLLMLLFLKESTSKNSIVQGDPSTFLFRSPLTIVKKDKLFLWYLVTGIVLCMGASQSESMLPLHFNNEKIMILGNDNPFPYLMALNGLLVCLFQFPIAKWLTNKCIGKSMFYGAILFGMGLIAIGWLPRWLRSSELDSLFTLVSLFSAYTVYTIGEMVLSPIRMTFISNIAPEHLRGTYMGIANLQWVVGFILGPLVGGVLLEHFLGHILFTILGIGCIISGIIYLFLNRIIKNASYKVNTSKHL